MAEFAGVFNAPVLQVAPCGLLSVASVAETNADPRSERWIRGFSTLSNASPTVRIAATNNPAPANGVIFDGSAVKTYEDVTPFWVEIESKKTAKDLISENPFDGTLIEQIEAASQKAAEYELWEGVAARDIPNPVSGYLIEENGATVVTTAGEDSARALALLEQSIANSPTGGRGVIHMTRDVASTLGSRLLYKAKNRDDKKAYAVTRLGTLVVVGSGYTGNGPIGVANRAASATNKWMFATGGVEVLLGKPEIANTSLAQGFDPSTNDSIVTVTRPVAAHFDPSIWYAAQVTLS